MLLVKRLLVGIILFICVLQLSVIAQNQDRLAVIEQKLQELAINKVPGLNQKVEISVNGAPIQEFLRSLANTNNVNLNLDPALNIRVVNNFANETFANVILFLAKEYELEVSFTGSIISISKYVPPTPIVEQKIKTLILNYEKGSDRLSFDLKNDSLDAVTKKITQLSGKNILWAPYLQGKLVSAYVQDMLFEEALNSLAYANDLSIIKKDDNLFLIEKAIAEDKNLKTLGNNKYQKGKPYQPSGNDQLLIEVDNEKHSISVDAQNVTLQDVLKAVAYETQTEYFLFNDLKGNVTSKIDARDYDEFLKYLFQGTDYTYKKQDSIYLIGERKLEGLRTSKILKLQYRSIENVIEAIPGEIKKGVEIKEFNELNAMVLSGSHPQIMEIENFVKQIDQVVPMIMIEVILLDIRKGKSIKTGLTAGLGDSSIATQGTILPGFDFTFSSSSINRFLSTISAGSPINLGKVTPNFYAGLSAIDQNNNANVRSMPKLATLNGHDANLSIGSTRYYSIQTQNLVGTQNPIVNTTQQFNAVQANMSINIKPFVSGDEQVTLDIGVQISDFIGDPPTNAPPPSSTSQFKSMVRVKSEEMVVLGGIERQERSESSTGLPILSRIPVLKWIFSAREKSSSKTTSIVFIKPSVIY